MTTRPLRRAKNQYGELIEPGVLAEASPYTRTAFRFRVKRLEKRDGKVYVLAEGGADYTAARCGYRLGIVRLVKAESPEVAPQATQPKSASVPGCCVPIVDGRDDVRCSQPGEYEVRCGSRTLYSCGNDQHLGKIVSWAMRDALGPAEVKKTRFRLAGWPQA